VDLLVLDLVQHLEEQRHHQHQDERHQR
jgi:hypothetical protein